MDENNIATPEDLEEASDEGESVEWLGTTAAARRLGITTRTLYRFINEGQIAAYRLGRVIRVKGDDIDSFIESCRIEPGTLDHLYPTISRDSEDGDVDPEFESANAD